MADQRKVIFRYGSRADYEALSSINDDTLYFLTDSGEIFKGRDNLTRSRCYEVEKTADETVDQAIANRTAGVVLSQNDVCVVKTLIAEIEGVKKYSYHAYIYNSDAKAWAPTVDNHRAEDVYFTEDVILSDNTIIQTAGKSLTTIMTPVLQKHQENDDVLAEFDEVISDLDADLNGYEAEDGTVVPGIKTEVSNLKQLTSGLQTKVDNLSTAILNTYTKEEVNDLISSVFHFKGVLNSVEELPSSATQGDVYQIGETEWVWNGEEWSELGVTVDLQGYATLDYVSNAISPIQKEVKSLADFIGTEATDELAATGLVGRITNIETKINNLETAGGGQVNVIEKIYADNVELAVNDKAVNIPVYDGTIAGLVPTNIANNASGFLDASGKWSIPQDSRIGTLECEGQVYNTVPEYVQAVINNTELYTVWESI